MFKKIILFSIILSLLPVMALADEFTGISSPVENLIETGIKSDYTTYETNPQVIIMDVITYALGLVGAFFLIMIIWAGFQWIQAGGNEEIVTKAKNRLKNSVIGFVIIMISYAIVAYTANFIRITANPNTNCAADYGGSCVPDGSCSADFNQIDYGQVNCGSGQTCCGPNERY